MSLFSISLGLSTLLCGLTAGIVLTFAVVVMPGIRRLDDAGFLQAFKTMDGVIQNNQPVFMFVWVGSAVALLATAVIGLGHLESWNLLFLIAATVLYILGVQVPTAAINIPLNKSVQDLDVKALSPSECHENRARFESRWNTWNRNRTIAAILTTSLLIVILLRS